jgi:carboxypeptidase Q
MGGGNGMTRQAVLPSVPTCEFPMRALRVALILSLLAPIGLAAQESVDTATVRRIREEALDRGQVMEIASWLTDVYGPRLTGSPISKQAGDWAVRKLTEWGLKGATLEPWGEFGRGWTNERTMVQVTAPVPFPVIAYPAAWTPGTNGLLSGRVVMAKIDSEPDFERYRGKLRGAIVMMGAPPEVKASWEPLARRLSDEELARMAAAPAAAAGRQGGPPNAEQMRARFAAARAFDEKRNQFFQDEGVAALLQAGRGNGGTVFVGGGGSRDPASPSTVPVLVLAVEHYGRIWRTLEKGLEVTMDLDVRNTFHDQDLTSFNVIAEIPGTDKKDEVVMLGGHFDSWHGATGATDNAAGSAVMMEAVRILKTLNLPLRRTVRIALWTGEEQGLLGSRAWVRKTYGAPDSLTPAAAKFSGYFNVDNGTGAIRGVYLQGNGNIAPVFDAWMKPFADKGVRTLTLQNTGGTDHLAFDAVGLPGFQFIQDPVEYSTRTHHSNMDSWDRLQPDDMKLNAAVVAAFVYLAANRPELLPRKGGLTP